MRPRLLLTVLLVLALGTVGGASAPAASAAPTPDSPSAGVGVGLVDIPAAAQDDPRARRYIIDNLPPGTSISRRMQVTNGTADAQDVTLYTGSARIVDGAFSGDPKGDANELAQWTSVDRPQLTLQPGAEEIVLVTIDVPADAPEGEQYAAVWAEITSSAEGETITTASRAGIRMYVSVAPGNGPAADFALGSLTASRAEDGTAVVVADVTNSGGRALDLTGELLLTEGPSGLSAGPFSSQGATTLAPGSSGRLVVELGPDLPDGPWRAELTATSGLLVRDITATVTFPEAGASQAAVQDDPPWVAVASVAALLLLLTVAAVVVVKRRRQRPVGRRAAHTA